MARDPQHNKKVIEHCVYCSNPPTGSFEQFADQLRTDPNWRFHEFKTGHDCMVTEPAETARLILTAA